MYKPFCTQMFLKMYHFEILFFFFYYLASVLEAMACSPSFSTVLI